MARKKQVLCAACKFTNRFGDPRCLICKAPLPQTEDAVLGDEPSPKAAPPKAAPPKGPPPKGPPPKAGPKGPPPKAAPLAGPRDTAQVVRAADARATAPRRVVDGTPLGGVEVVDATRGRPSSRLVSPPEGALDRTKIVAWLCCEPLPPIPLGAKPLLSIGRQADCDLVLPHKEVSRRHAVVKVRGTTIVFEDEGSSNGSFVNGNRVSHSTLRVGDTISLGPYEVVLRSNEEMTRPSDGKGDTSTNLELTSVSRLNPAAALTGKLQEVPLTELLQGIEFNKKTGTLTINADGQQGVLVVSEGLPQFATWGALSGDDAVLAMLSLVKGRFTFNGQVEPGERTMRATITGLLLEASRRIDEGETANAEPGTPGPAEAAAGADALDALDAPGGDGAGAPEGDGGGEAPGGGDDGGGGAGEAPGDAGGDGDATAEGQGLDDAATAAVHPPRLGRADAEAPEA